MRVRLPLGALCCLLMTCYDIYIVGARLGLLIEGCTALSGEEVERIDLGYLRNIINKVAVFYRVTPRNKLKIVKVLHPLLITLPLLFVCKTVFLPLKAIRKKSKFFLLKKKKKNLLSYLSVRQFFFLSLQSNLKKSEFFLLKKTNKQHEESRFWSHFGIEKKSSYSDSLQIYCHGIKLADTVSKM